MRSLHTGLLPDWGRGFHAASTDVISHDDDLVRAGFTDLIRGSRPSATVACLRGPQAPEAAAWDGPAHG